jgi:hypothetical protein
MKHTIIPDIDVGLSDEELRSIYKYIENALKTAATANPRKGFSQKELIDLRRLCIIGENFAARLDDSCALRKSNYNADTRRVEFKSNKSGKLHSIEALAILEREISALSEGYCDPSLLEVLYCAPGTGTRRVSRIVERLFKAAGVLKPGREISFKSFRRRAATAVADDGISATTDLTT